MSAESPDPPEGAVPENESSPQESPPLLAAVATPEDAMRDVLAFLEEEYDDAVLKPNFLERDVRPLVIGP